MTQYPRHNHRHKGNRTFSSPTAANRTKGYHKGHRKEVLAASVGEQGFGVWDSLLRVLALKKVLEE